MKSSPPTQSFSESSLNSLWRNRNFSLSLKYCICMMSHWHALAVRRAFAIKVWWNRLWDRLAMFFGTETVDCLRLQPHTHFISRNAKPSLMEINGRQRLQLLCFCGKIGFNFPQM